MVLVLLLSPHVFLFDITTVTTASTGGQFEAWMEVTQHLWHNSYTNVYHNTFSSLVEILVGMKARTCSIDCKKGDHLPQRGPIYSAVDYLRGPPTSVVHLLSDRFNEQCNLPPPVAVHVTLPCSPQASSGQHYPPPKSIYQYSQSSCASMTSGISDLPHPKC